MPRIEYGCCENVYYNQPTIYHNSSLLIAVFFLLKSPKSHCSDHKHCLLQPINLNINSIKTVDLSVARCASYLGNQYIETNPRNQPSQVFCQTYFYKVTSRDYRWMLLVFAVTNPLILSLSPFLQRTISLLYILITQTQTSMIYPCRGGLPKWR